MRNINQRIQDLMAIGRTHKVVHKVRCNHVAGIWLDNRLVAIGRNRKKSHPLQARFADRPQRIYLHAEIDAIVDFLTKFHISNCASAEMIVIRLDAEGNLADSKPCAGCQKALITFGFKDIEWS
jgi:hypothetical protein